MNGEGHELFSQLVGKQTQEEVVEDQGVEIVFDPC